ncbi:helix-turn-helix domain-containing protein [Legionella dresdenensis]|uniref:Helix-turn-helix domain-containing protein n=1 Tax=Legionella dresdenensis TaxID=450200 RepID=A0ABV8CG55_9GAMM
MSKKITITPTPDFNAPISPELIGKAIRAKRTQSQLRLEDAAALCGVAKQTLANAEHGHPNTQISTLLQICASLGIHITILPWQDNEVNNEWQ